MSVGGHPERLAYPCPALERKQFVGAQVGDLLGRKRQVIACPDVEAEQRLVRLTLGFELFGEERRGARRRLVQVHDLVQKPVRLLLVPFVLMQADEVEQGVLPALRGGRMGMECLEQESGLVRTLVGEKVFTRHQEDLAGLLGTARVEIVEDLLGQVELVDRFPQLGGEEAGGLDRSGFVVCHTRTLAKAEGTHSPDP